MRRQSNRYTFLFALAVCVTCSLVLSIVSEGLKKKQELNIALDIKKNILKAVDLKDPVPEGALSQDILKIYEKKIQEVVIDNDGKIIEGKTPDEIKENDEAYPLYIYKENQQVMAYCFPIVGKGLWSTLYGYFALEPDAVTVRGITFYRHGETPGLGAEIEKEWFQNNFKGKKIWDMKNQRLFPTKVVKGKVEEVVPKDQQAFYVDGISGATMTSKGVTAMLEKWIKVYEPFFVKIRKNFK